MGQILDSPPPGFGGTPAAPAPVTVQQGAPVGRTPIAPPAPAPAPVSQPTPGTFANPPEKSGEVRAPTWLDTLNPSGWLGVEPGSPQTGLQIASKAMPFVSPAVQFIPRVAAMGPAGKAAANAAANFFTTGGDPTATAIGGVQGGLAGAVKKVFSDPSRTTRFWSGFADAIEKGRPNLAPGIQSLGGDASKLAGYEGRAALQRAASAPFDAAMKQVEGAVGKNTAIDLPMTVKQATDLGLWDATKPVGPNGWPTATFQEMREVIKDLRFRDADAARRIENALTTHLSTQHPKMLPVYERAIQDYRADSEIIRAVIELQERRALPGGALREDTPQGIVRAIDKIAPPRNPRAPGGEDIAQNLAGVVMPRTAHAIAAGRGLRNILSQKHGVPPVQAPTAPQKVNLGQWAGAGAAEIPAYLNLQIPTEERARMLTPGYWMGQQ